MSGFDPRWLSLREPADAAARNPKILAACAAHFSDREKMAVVDLGCGTGSNLRALAPHLPRQQTWRLVDHDPVLLEAARKTLVDWSDTHAESDGALRLEKGDRTLRVELVCADLAHDLAGAMGDNADLVTAAALFDLTSVAWIRAFCGRLAACRAPLYAVLIYNGVESWSPLHPADVGILAAFHAHQRRDKGFGASAGPDAARALLGALEQCGYRVGEAESDWRLGQKETDLIASLAAGIAAAVRDTGLVADAAIDSWLAARMHASARIGHIDLFAAL